MEPEIPWQQAGFCEDCGQPSDEGYFDVAVHDCDSGTWRYISFNREKLGLVEPG
jgi:hypothetical protein